MALLFQLRRALKPRFLFSDSASIQFRSMSSKGTLLHTIFLQSPARSAMDNMLHNMQADALNQLVVSEELDPHNVGTGRYVLADSWTTDRLFSLILHFPSAANPCIKFITVQHSYLCKSRISDFKVGDVVQVQACLYRRDGYEHQTPVKVYAVLATCMVIEHNL
ncbi:hypothetical protein B0H17DRAFT_1144147 [Mycena rosella]|uniref:Uncharacterized protein n=1 Tax=Mycena rosella TaxID=1033263 RepID=A0AAD7CTV4_MYCRO|nr:hypothetical protein B0H17DRAFT_1144147 [Mycena rosella]